MFWWHLFLLQCYRRQPFHSTASRNWPRKSVRWGTNGNCQWLVQRKWQCREKQQWNERRFPPQALRMMSKVQRKAQKDTERHRKTETSTSWREDFSTLIGWCCKENVPSSCQDGKARSCREDKSSQHNWCSHWWSVQRNKHSAAYTFINFCWC